VHLDPEQMGRLLLVGASVTLVAILAVRLTLRAGFPSLVVYLLIGVLLGSAGAGIRLDDPDVAAALGYAGLVLILAEGGLTTHWPDYRQGLRIGIALATIGVAVGVTLMSLGLHYLLGMPWELAVILAAVIAPTDSAAVFAILRRVPIPRRVGAALEAESGLNDAPTAVLVTLLSAGSALDHGVLGFAGLVVYQLAAGVAIGLAVGFGGAWVMRRAALPSSGLYPLSVLCLCVVAYGAGALALASGFAAVYTAALVLGNAELPHRGATRSFAEGLGWLAQIGIFVMLGLLVTPGDLEVTVVLEALLVGFLLSFVARPVLVAVSSLFARTPWNEQVFIAWAGLAGAVPIVLATIPLSEGVDRAGELFNIVFVMTVVYTLLTGPTLPLAARILRVAVPEEPRDPEIEAAPLEQVAADLLQVSITQRSRMHGVEVSELRLPVGALVTLIVRDGETLVPDGRTVLRRGDSLLVVTPRRLRERTEERLRSISRGGRLADWNRS
jgi:cell volume regulation protein A